MADTQPTHRDVKVFVVLEKRTGEDGGLVPHSVKELQAGCPPGEGMADEYLSEEVVPHTLVEGRVISRLDPGDGGDDGLAAL